jgi:nitroreductase
MSFKQLDYKTFPEEELVDRSSMHRQQLSTRRSVRHFSKKPVPLKVIKNVVMTAASAPSGANQQPWTFVVVGNQKLKNRIRNAAEKEERSFYQQRAPNEWLAKVAPLGTDWRKPFLEDAPFLIIVFKQIYGMNKGSRVKHYYVDESVGIAVGFLLTAIHQIGLVALTHTPSPMGFLSQILKRPANERAYLIIPVGYPEENAKVPVITKKAFEEISNVF